MRNIDLSGTLEVIVGNQHAQPLQTFPSRNSSSSLVYSLSIKEGIKGGYLHVRVLTLPITLLVTLHLATMAKCAVDPELYPGTYHNDTEVALYRAVGRVNVTAHVSGNQAQSFSPSLTQYRKLTSL